MFGITEIVKGYSIQTYYLYCYAIFISEDITRQRGGVTFGTPCTNVARGKQANYYSHQYASGLTEKVMDA